jgi:hypothetical protein
MCGFCTPLARLKNDGIVGIFIQWMVRRATFMFLFAL